MVRHHDPSVAPDNALFEAWRADGDEAARGTLIERYLPLARKLAGRYARAGEPFEDLIQVASVGLIKAVERYDPGRGTAFTSFAVPTILGELKRHFRDSTWTLRVDRRGQERARAVTAARRALIAAGCANPTVPDLAAFLDCEVEEVLEGLQAALAYSAVSLDAPAPTLDAEPAVTLGDQMGVADARLELADDRATLGEATRHLPKLERQILFLRFGEDLSQREIAARVGISQMHVSRLLQSSLGRLREQFGDRPQAA